MLLVGSYFGSVPKFLLHGLRAVAVHHSWGIFTQYLRH